MDGEAGVPEPGVDPRRVEATPRRRRTPRSVAPRLRAGRLRVAAAGRRTCSRRSCPTRRIRQMSATTVIGAEVGVGRVADAVGVAGEQRVGVLGGDHADGVDPADDRPRPGPPWRPSGPTARRARGPGAPRWPERRGCRRCRSPTGSLGTPSAPRSGAGLRARRRDQIGQYPPPPYRPRRGGGHRRDQRSCRDDRVPGPAEARDPLPWASPAFESFENVYRG